MTWEFWGQKTKMAKSEHFATLLGVIFLFQGVLLIYRITIL